MFKSRQMYLFGASEMKLVAHIAVPLPLFVHIKFDLTLNYLAKCALGSNEEYGKSLQKVKCRTTIQVYICISLFGNFERSMTVKQW